MFNLLFSQPICSDESLIEQAVKASSKNGGCCFKGDDGYCKQLDRSEFGQCCQKTCNYINSTYGCTLSCDNGECDHMRNFFSNPVKYSDDDDDDDNYDGGDVYKVLTEANLTPEQIKQVREFLKDAMKKNGMTFPEDKLDKIVDCFLSEISDHMDFKKYLDHPELTPTPKEQTIMLESMKDCVKKYMHPDPVNPKPPKPSDKKDGSKNILIFVFILIALIALLFVYKTMKH